LEQGVGAPVHSSLAFDLTVTGLFGPLLAGGRVELIPEAAGVEGLGEALRQAAEPYSLVKLTPAHLEMLAQQLGPEQAAERTRAFIIGGENLLGEALRFWQQHAPGTVLVNEYGPTETVVGCSVYQVLDAVPREGSVSIGRAITNTQLYVLDAQLQPVPVGVSGELYIGGAGVARGYLGRPELTAERFVPDPFSGEAGARLYRTGDAARYLADGNLEFLGRLDDQVKVRGFRIELGEIEAALRECAGVRDVAVVAREDAPGQRRLVAYVVPDGQPPAINALREQLGRTLPEYMVPSAFVSLESLPLTPNGKVDRKALPAPEVTREELGSAYVAPRTPEEEMLAELWSQVLGVERVGVHDNFAELGGHSLLATQLMARVREAFQVEVPLRTLFEAPTVAELAKQVAELRRSHAGLHVPPIRPVARGQQELPLSFAQQRLWFLDQLEPGNLFYNIPLAVRLKGALDADALRRALNEIVRRHEALRTTFAAVDGRPVQVIAPELSIPLPVEDLRGLTPEKREAEALRLATEDAQTPFDLGGGPLLRARLLQVDDAEHIAVLVLHHIVSDGWSMRLLIRELAALYHAYAAGRPSPLPELPIQYADYAAWQREWLQGDVLETQLDYWRKQLAGAPPLLELPTDHPRPAMQTYHGAIYSFGLSKELAQGLKRTSQKANCTLFMTLLAAFQTLLYRYTGQDDICVGTSIANRNRAETEDLIGFFVNTLVMRADLSDAPNFQTLLGRVREAALGAYTHQDVPFEMLVEKLQPERNLSHTPLFQVMFVMDNASQQSLELPDLVLSPVSVDVGKATFDLTLSMMEGDEGLGGYIEYNTDLFEAETIRRMVGHLQTLLEGIVAAPDCSVARLPLLTADERQQVLAAWNETTRPLPGERCMHELFEEQAARQPDAVAVVFEGETLTYAELNRRANQLARYLRRLGVGPETLVGLCALRGPEMVVGVLGVWKAGGAYVPLDPSYPPERLAYMLADARVPVLLTQEALVRALPAHDARVVQLDADWPQIARESEASRPNVALPEGLAYVIYTSGSTGRPKGTLLAHRGLVNLSRAQRDVFGVGPGSRVLQFAPWSFDASVWELVMALGNGAALVLARQEVLASGPELGRLLQEEAVTHVTLPPSVLRGLKRDGLDGLRTVVAAGEACPVELARAWSVGRQFVDAYGPTETTVCASLYVCQPEERIAPPIGKALPNFRLYVLDRRGEPVPVGVPGELCVGGIGLARGYLNRPDLTAERFVPDPFSGEAGARLYRTGGPGAVQARWQCRVLWGGLMTR
jgi:amino acid adenylation domain-containing protein